ncbi:MAG: hypothetical protein IJO61_00190 [Oscillospiraceae bacterium]|nr:hypothetical protein [Oscillospiraceae bacterium]
MKKLTLEEHRRRIENINSAEAENKKYFRRHRIRDYLPGQATYNLGDYPARFSITPTEYDYNLLKDMSEKGVELIQIHEEWNDSIRHLGADKFTSHDPDGLQKFVDLCHNFGIKIIPYVSTGYFSLHDPDYREEFARGAYDLSGDHFHYRKCFCGSPEWRNYMIPRTIDILDKYSFDGIYNDWGYDGFDIAEKKAIESGIDISRVTTYDMPYDPMIEDLLGTIYSEVKKRGGIYKLHADRNNTAPCKDKVYDYLWIGEGIADNDGYGIGKSYEQYIVPCQHAEFSDTSNPDYYYAKVIPFMQFPLLKKGRPLLGRGLCEDIDYVTDSIDHQHKLKIRDYMEKHPDGPYIYSLWSAIPDDVEEYPRWARYLALYRPMVEENSVAYIELRECDEILSELPKNIYASMFVNEEKYLVVSNLTETEYTLELRSIWVDRVSKEEKKTFTIRPKEMIFLVKK